MTRAGLAPSKHLKRSGTLVVLMAAGLLACVPSASANELPTLPVAPLAGLEGFEGEAQAQRFYVQQVAMLAQRAEQAADALERAELQLTAANLILARQLEPACSRALLGLPVGQTPADLRPLFERTRTLLADAGESLNQNRAPQAARGSDEPPTQRRSDLADDLHVLEAFAAGLEAYLLPAGDAEEARTVRKAASGLATLLEHDDQTVAVAASLWHAVLRAQDGEPDRVLGFVPLALKEPGHQELPYAFHSRLLRCRLLAARADGPVAALALLYQLEERCHEWLSEPAERAQAFRAASLVELQILSAWHQRLGDPKHQAARQWCTEQIVAVIEERFSEPSAPVYRLVHAIPVLLPPGEGP